MTRSYHNTRPNLVKPVKRRRTPPKSVLWNGQAWVCVLELEDRDIRWVADGEDDAALEPLPSEGAPRRLELEAPHVRLQDIWRQGKPRTRGVAGEFEWVKGVSRVIILDDHADQDRIVGEDDDWEKVDASEALPQRLATYSSVVRSPRR